MTPLSSLDSCSRTLAVLWAFTCSVVVMFRLRVMVVVILMRILNLGGINQLLADMCHAVATRLDQLQRSSWSINTQQTPPVSKVCTHLTTLRHYIPTALDQLTFQGSYSPGHRLHSLEQCVQDLLFQFQRIDCRLFALQYSHNSSKVNGTRERDYWDVRDKDHSMSVWTWDFSIIQFNDDKVRKIE